MFDYHILGDLEAAIDSNEFYVVLQPKCDLTNGKAIGLEALLRWKKQETMIPPNVFIPLAERSGLINKHKTPKTFLLEGEKLVETQAEEPLTKGVHAFANFGRMVYQKGWYSNRAK